jgi:tetratricopeptide (TPR) repeat protein
MNEYSEQLAQAETLRQEGEHSLAIEICQKILIENLDCGEAYEEIGDNYLSLQKYNEAEKALSRAVQLNPGSANGNYLLGFVYSERSEYEKALEYFEKADTLRPNHAEILRCLGWCYFHSTAPRRGLVILERARTLSPQDTLILLDLGVCLLTSRKQKEAKRYFLQVLELEPNNDKAITYLKQIEKMSGTSKKG